MKDAIKASKELNAIERTICVAQGLYTEKELREDCDRFMNTINKPQKTKD